MGASNRTVAPNQVTTPVTVPHLSWHRFPTMRYVLSVSLVILSTYPILLQLADVLPRKTVVDLSRGSCKQLRKTGTRKCKITKAQSGSSTLTSKRARAITNKTSNKEVSAPGGLSRDSSLMSIESLTHLSMHGLQAMVMHSWQLSCTGSMTTGSLVRNFPDTRCLPVFTQQF
jgi:hypothetical protein